MIGVGVLTWRYLVDDAFIVARYAGHLAGGEGWAMNPGVPSDGVTGPLWLLPVSAGSALGLNPLDVQRALGLACTALAVALAVRDQSERRPVLLLVVVQGTLGLWGGAGLETGLATLALTAVARPTWGAHAIGWVAAAAVAIPWLRPELVPVALVLAFGVGGRRRGVVLGSLAAGAVAVVAFRWALFGHPLPLASAAKLGGLADGFRYVAIGVVLLTGIGGAVLVGVAARAGQPGMRVLALALVVHGLTVALAGGDWMPAHRLFVPVLPLYAVAAARGFRALSSRWRWAAFAFALLVPAGLTVLEAQLAWEAGAQRVARAPAVADAVRGRGPVALVDVGYVGWATGVEVIDLGGITDPVVARAPGGHLDKRVPLGHLVAREPRTILLHSARRPQTDDEGRLTALAGYPVERRVARLGWVRAHFRVGAIVEYGPDYWYVRLDRVAE